MGEWRYSSIILDLGTRWRWVVSVTPLPLYPQEKINQLDSWLGGPQSWSGSCEEKNLAPAGNRTRAVHPQSVAISTPEMWFNSAKYRVYHLKHNPINGHILWYVNEIISCFSNVHEMESPKFCHDTWVNVTVQLLCRCEHVYSWAENDFILEDFFALLRQAFSNAYPDKEVPNKTTLTGW
jgi:hypothetical protein